MDHPTDRIAHITAFVTPIVEHWLEQEIAQWVHYKGRSDDPSHHERILLPWSYIYGRGGGGALGEGTCLNHAKYITNVLNISLKDVGSLWPDTTGTHTHTQWILWICHWLQHIKIKIDAI